MTSRVQRVIAKAFDGCIRAMGGNVDPRAANNRDRLALMKFYDAISKLDTDMYTGMSIKQAMKKIINERIVYTKSQGKTEFSVYDCMGKKLDDE